MIYSANTEDYKDHYNDPLLGDKLYQYILEEPNIPLFFLTTTIPSIQGLGWFARSLNHMTKELTAFSPQNSRLLYPVAKQTVIEYFQTIPLLQKKLENIVDHKNFQDSQTANKKKLILIQE